MKTTIEAETESLAQQLVRTDSVNPSLVPGAPGEQAVASICQTFLADYGIQSEHQPVLDGRENLIGVVPGDGTGRSVLLCCHMDTVGVAGMDDPFSGDIEGDRLHGRGSQDIKGGLAAMLSAAAVLSRDKSEGGDIHLAAVVDEEAYSRGTQTLIERGVRADAAIVFEPTDLQVMIAHKGFQWLAVETDGVAAHGSRPDEGVDAIAHMGRVLVSLEALQKRLSQDTGGTDHPLLGTGSVHASLITGGRELSSYPDTCRLDVERRTVPGEHGSVLHDELDAICRELSAGDSKFKARLVPRLTREPFAIEPTEALPSKLAEIVARHNGPPGYGGMTGWTDSALLHKVGIPSVVFGPGGDGLHGLNEWVRVSEIHRARDILVDFIREFRKG